MKTSNIFRKAVPWLASPGELPGWRKDGTFANEYICYAIGDATDADNARRGQKIIATRLADCSSAETWLQGRGLHLSYDDRQRWRHMWLERLIAEFEAKGD